MTLAGRSMTAQPNLPNKFTGKERDTDFGLDWDYFGARYYDAVIGRWMVLDPLADDFPSWTPYNYVLNNPTGNTDPDGNAVCGGLCVGAAIAGAFFADAIFPYPANAPSEADEVAGRVEQGTSDLAFAAQEAAGLGFGVVASRFISKGFNAVRNFFKGGVDDAAKGGIELFHFTSAAKDKIVSEGLRPGASGKVFTTPQGNLSPIQAQLDLALPPNRGLPQNKAVIDVNKLKELGIKVPEGQQVARKFNMPGGGIEVVIPNKIPKEAIKKVEELK